MPFTILGFSNAPLFCAIFSTSLQFLFIPAISQTRRSLACPSCIFLGGSRIRLTMLCYYVTCIVSLYLHLLCIISSSIRWLSSCWPLNSNLAIINTLIKCSIPLALSYPSNSYPAILTILTMLSSRSHHAVITIFGMLY